MTESEEFTKEPLIKTVRRAAEVELSGKASSSDVQVLYDNPLMWLRALSMIRREINYHIAKDRLSLVEYKPVAGTHASDEYLKMKAEVDERSRRRLHFQNIVEKRLEDAKSILGPNIAEQLIVGDLVLMLVDIVNDANHDDIEAIIDRANFWIKKLTDSQQR